MREMTEIDLSNEFIIETMKGLIGKRVDVCQRFQNKKNFEEFGFIHGDEYPLPSLMDNRAGKIVKVTDKYMAIIFDEPIKSISSNENEGYVFCYINGKIVDSESSTVDFVFDDENQVQRFVIKHQWQTKYSRFIETRNFNILKEEKENA